MWTSGSWTPVPRDRTAPDCESFRLLQSVSRAIRRHVDSCFLVEVMPNSRVEFVSRRSGDHGDVQCAEQSVIGATTGQVPMDVQVHRLAPHLIPGYRRRIPLTACNGPRYIVSSLGHTKTLARLGIAHPSMFQPPILRAVLSMASRHTVTTSRSAPAADGYTC